MLKYYPASLKYDLGWQRESNAAAQSPTETGTWMKRLISTSADPASTQDSSNDIFRCNGFPMAKVKSRCSGVTLIELMIIIAIIATLATLATPIFSAYTTGARNAKAVEDIGTIEREIMVFEVEYGRLPSDLAEIGMHTLRDPWGNPFQYTNFEVAPKGKWRKDKFLVRINSTFDLWSMGPMVEAHLL
jgi:type II secretory pathway pseudopilin PulG